MPTGEGTAEGAGEGIREGTSESCNSKATLGGSRGEPSEDQRRARQREAKRREAKRREAKRRDDGWKGNEWKGVARGLSVQVGKRVSRRDGRGRRRGRGSERANARVREGLAWGVLYVAGSIQPRALDSKLPLSAVFPLFSHSPQPSPRCYLPIVLPPFAPSPSPTTSNAFSYNHPPTDRLSSRPPSCGSATGSRYNFHNDYSVFLPSVIPVSRKCRETRRTSVFGGTVVSGLRIHFPWKHGLLTTTLLDRKLNGRRVRIFAFRRP